MVPVYTRHMLLRTAPSGMDSITDFQQYKLNVTMRK